ncbi:MAG: DUF389 domain-containing protein [Myxococcota bacterium]|nr:DUF389 domain-containing protein [Myxococcota bacterium]
MAIVVVATEVAHISQLVPWSWLIAKHRQEGLIVALFAEARDESIHDVDPAAALVDEDPLVAEVQRVSRDYAVESESDPDTSDLIIRSIRSASIRRAVMAEIQRIQPSLLIVSARWAKDAEERTLAQYLFNRAPCALMAVTGEADGAPQKILVPTTDDQNAREALRIAAALLSDVNAEVTALNFQAASVEDGDAVGQRVLKRALIHAGVEAEPRINARVKISNKIPDGIREAATAHDAILMGASERGVLYRALFGTLPDELLRGADGRLMAVVRSRRRWGFRLHDLVERLLHLWVPQMDRSTRIAVYEQLQTGSRWGFDFMMLIALSTSIAALGLIQSSAAVVIGAMLVAPLMTPMLGAGLALLQGNRLLLREAIRAIGLGFLLALLIGSLVGFLSPVKVLTPEMSARGLPTLLDLSVALLAGFAAAYAYARPHLLAALPGVAIAAALVPPIATTGVCLSMGEIGVAAGAALLFCTNVVAIVVGATIAFYAFGLRGRQQQRMWVQRTFLTLIAAMFLLAIPLSAYLWSIAQRSPTGLTLDVRQTAKAHGYRLVHLEHDGEVLELKVQGRQQPPAKLLSELDEVVTKQFGHHVTLRVITELAIVVKPNQPSSE